MTTNYKRVRNPQQLERKRLLDRLSQQSKRMQQKANIEAVHEQNRNMRQEIDRLRSGQDSMTHAAHNLLPCCNKTGEHIREVACFEKIVFDTLMQTHLCALPPLPRNPPVEDLLLLRQPENPASAILFVILQRPSLQNPLLRSAFYLLAWRILRYRLCPSQETYADVPLWLRTTEVEDSTPHPVLFDFIIFPQLRKALVLGQVDIETGWEQFQFDVTSHISLHWPPSMSLAAINNTCDTIVNPSFETHISTLGNWSLDEGFARKYPSIARLVSIRN